MDSLPKKAPENLSASEIEDARKAISIFKIANGNPLGKGNGWEITRSINIYLLNFFNKFLKHEEEPAFEKCVPLANNTLITCGPDSL